MLTYNVTIKGTTPILMNKPSIEIASKSKNRKLGDETETSLATDKLYAKDGKLFQPSTHLEGCLLNAGKEMKVMGKGTSRATYSKIIGYAVEVYPFEIPHKKQSWEVFSILSVNPTTKGRNLLCRPMLRAWELDFEIRFDETELSAETLKDILEIGGKKVGIGDWRPQKKGKFGKFEITRFEKKK